MRDYNINFKEALGIFENDDKLQDAVHALNSAGFDRYKLSVIGSENAMNEKFNVSYKDPKDLMDNPKTPRAANISPEEVGIGEGVVVGSSILAGVITALIAAGGVMIPAVIPATVIGMTAGEAFGAAAAQWLGNTHAIHLQRQIDAGGLILWVRIENEDEEKLALELLNQYGAHDIHIHTIKDAVLL